VLGFVSVHLLPRRVALPLGLAQGRPVARGEVGVTVSDSLRRERGTRRGVGVTTEAVRLARWACLGLGGVGLRLDSPLPLERQGERLLLPFVQCWRMTRASLLVA